MAAGAGFENIWDFPQCFGAVNRSHALIRVPAVNASDYYNHKKFPSMLLLQAMVDHEHHFMNAYGYD